MTETKRFNDFRGYKRFDSYFDDYMQLWTVSDNENDNMLYPCTSKNMANEFTKLLNELNDENEQLRKENDMFSCELSVSVNKEISRNCRIAELEEENEQLKKRIAHLKNKLAYKDQHNTDKFRGIEDWAKGGF